MFECLGLGGQDALANILKFWAHTSYEFENLNAYFLCGLGNITTPKPHPQVRTCRKIDLRLIISGPVLGRPVHEDADNVGVLTNTLPPTPPTK